jgi:arylsulfatase A-like enzyme
MRVLVIVVRGLHLGYVGCYGNDWIDTPTQDGLAAEGVVFDQHFADQPDPAGAAHAWRTGRYGLPATEAEGSRAAEPETDLASLLRGSGVSLTLLQDLSGSRPTALDGAQGVCRIEPRRGKGTRLQRVLDAAVPAVEDLASRDRRLVWVELATLLPPWDVPRDFLERYLQAEPQEDEEDEEDDPEPLDPLADPVPGPLEPPAGLTFVRLQRTYAAAVSCLDAGLGRLFEQLRERSLLDDLLVILTTDHGLPLGEHGVVGLSRPWPHEELIHLPLLVRLPGGADAGRRVAALTQPVDLLPTLLDAFGLPPPPVHGHSLLPLARGEREQVRSYACSGLRIGASAEWALRSPGWSFLLPLGAAADGPPRPPQLYVKPDDRWEVNNVLQHHLELAEHLEQTLRTFVTAAGRPGPLQAPELRDVEAELAEAAADPNPTPGEETQP